MKTGLRRFWLALAMIPILLCIASSCMAPPPGSTDPTKDDLLALARAIPDAVLQVEGTAYVLKKAPHLMPLLDANKNGVLELADFEALDPRSPVTIVKLYVIVKELVDLQRRKPPAPAPPEPTKVGQGPGAGEEPFAPPAPPPKHEIDAERLAAAWARVAPKPEAVARLLAAPLPRQRYQQGQCWVEVSGHLAAYEHRDEHWQQGWSFQCGTNTRLHAYGTTDGAASALLNYAPTFTGASGLSPLAAQVAIPAEGLRVVATDGLVIVSTTTAAGSRGPLPYPGGRSNVDEMLPVSFVEWQPGPEYFRAPVIGDGFLRRYLAASPVRIDRMRMQLLPRAVDEATLPIDWNAWGQERPSTMRLTQLCARFCGLITSGWSSDTLSPDWQTEGYGREEAGVVSAQLVRLCSTANDVEKWPLARNLCQQGFDLVAMFAAGKYEQANGGHCKGRKARVVFFGWAIDCEPIRQASAILGPVFQEDCAYVTGPRWDGGTARWRYNSTGDASADWTKPPAQWGADFEWQLNGYLQHNLQADVGTALWARLTDNVHAWSPQGVELVEWFMTRPVNWTAGTKCRVEWGGSWMMGGGANYAAAAYAQDMARRLPSSALQGLRTYR